MSKLKSITMNSFKGSTNEITVEFLNTNLTVIYGENGTGKSTIADAFDVICNKNAGSLEEKSIGSPKSKYLINLKKNAGDCIVKMKYDNREWSSSLGRGSQPTTTGAPDIPKVFIIRRDKILDFITKQPASRYEKIKDFIETPNCGKTEELTNRLKIQYDSESENSIRAIADTEASLQRLWELEGKAGNNYWGWAEQETSRIPEQIRKDIDTISSVLKAYRELKSQKELFDLSSISLSEHENEYLEINTDFDRLASQTELNISELVDLLIKSKEYIEKSNDLIACPVCEQSVDRQTLLTNVNNRLTTKNQIITLKTKLLNSQRNLEAVKAQVSQNKLALMTKGVILYNVLSSLNPPEYLPNEFNLEQFVALKGTETPELTKIELAILLYDSMQTFEPIFAAKKDRYEKTLNSHNAISTFVNTILEKRRDAYKLNLLKERVTQLHTIFVEQRKLYIKEMLDSVSGDIDRMYSSIHPNENIGNINLCPNENRRASIELTSSFEGTPNIQPQAYYSESHLDTLGICLFIALSKKYGTRDSILIFDDVVTSADQIHLQRFLGMLEAELQHFQHTIITTHYQIWRDKYRYGSGNVQLVELLRWAIDRGIRHTKTKLYTEELREHLTKEPFDKQIVASKAGVFLELILDNLALMFRCKLPRKSEPFYTLGEFINGFSSNLKKRMHIDIVEGTDVVKTFNLEEYFNLLPADSALRNQVGCHFNVVGEHFTDEDVELMAQNTLNLANVLICDNCGELPYKSRSGSYYECKCNKKRLYPLID